MAHGNRKATPLNSKDYFQFLYIDKKMSYKDIAKFLGLGLGTVQARAKEHGIKAHESNYKNWGNQHTKGLAPWNKGKTKETDRRINEYSKKLKGTKKPWMAGEKHPMWGKVNESAKGERNHNWKGGVTSSSRKERVKFRESIQKKVFERDNYTCVICGIRGADLQVDHIQSWADYVDLRFNMDNCRTLCAKCHYQITFNKPMPENIKGWGHNILKGVSQHS